MKFSVLALLAAITSTTSVIGTDVDTLQYALTLENLEAAFYNAGMKNYTSDMFVAAGLSTDDYSYFQIIQAHENAHVATLSAAIQGLGSTPVPACTYVFPAHDVLSFVQTSLALEQTGVSAYDGAIGSITGAAYQQVAATIATIEARHATFVQTAMAKLSSTYQGVLGGPVPGGVTDAPRSSSDVYGVAKSFIVSCPTNAALTLPTNRPLVSDYNTATVTGNSTITLSQNDLNTLQYALTLENFEAAFYKKYVGLPQNWDGQNSAAVAGQYNQTDIETTAGYPAGTFAYLQLISAHESSHVSFLNSAISSAKASPVQACGTYGYGTINNVNDFINTAATIEGLGVSAYDGAINTIENAGYAQVAATIATVEARHSTFLYGLAYGKTQTTPKPLSASPTDAAISPADVVNKVVTAGFIPSSCAQATGLVLPVTPTAPPSSATSSMPSTMIAAIAIAAYML